MNDDFSRHLGAAIYCFVNEIVKEVVEELKGQTTVAKNQSVASMPEDQEYMTRKEVMRLLKRCDSTMTKWARRGYLVPCCVGGKYLYRKSDVMKLVGVRG